MPCFGVNALDFRGARLPLFVPCLSFPRSVLPCLSLSFPFSDTILRFGPSLFACMCLPTRLPKGLPTGLPVRSPACCVSSVKTYPAAAFCCQMLFDVVNLRIMAQLPVGSFRLPARCPDFYLFSNTAAIPALLYTLGAAGSNRPKAEVFGYGRLYTCCGQAERQSP